MRARSRAKKVKPGFWQSEILSALTMAQRPLDIFELATRIRWPRPDRKRDIITFINKLEDEGSVEKFAFERPTRKNMKDRRWVATSVLEEVTKPGTKTPDWFSSEAQRDQLILDFSRRVTKSLSPQGNAAAKTLKSWVAAENGASAQNGASARPSSTREYGRGVETVWEILRVASKPLSASEISRRSYMERAMVYRALRKLGRAGGLSVTGTKGSKTHPLHFAAVTSEMPKIRRKRRARKQATARRSPEPTLAVSCVSASEDQLSTFAPSSPKFQNLSWEEFQVIAKWEGHNPEVLLAEIVNRLRG